MKILFLIIIFYGYFTIYYSKNNPKPIKTKRKTQKYEEKTLEKKFIIQFVKNQKSITQNSD